MCSPELNIPKNHLVKLASLNFLNNSNRYSERISFLVRDLKELDADILCLQEVLLDENSKLTEALEGLGYNHKYLAAHTYTNRGEPQGNAIYSRIPMVETGDLTAGVEGEIPMATAKFIVNGQEIYTVSGHFFFGPEDKTHLRTQQAITVTDYALKIRATNKDAIVLLSGDLNSTPETDTILFLQGKRSIADRSTFWIDSYECSNSDDNWVTSDPTTFWSVETAVNANNPYFPHIAPKRRIDYIFSHGWKYGNPGMPVSFKTWGKGTETTMPVSDHFGVFAEIFCPPVRN